MALLAPSPMAARRAQAVDVLDRGRGHLVSDIEGVTLADQPDGQGYIIVSAQNVADPNNSYFSVYRRERGNDFVKTFRVVRRSQLRRLRPHRRDHGHDGRPRSGVPARHVRLPGQQQRRSRDRRATRTSRWSGSRRS